jgi:hypothetical protein
MKFLAKSVLNILIFLLILVIPVTLFVTFFTLRNLNLPLWNIGIANVLVQARKFLLPSIVLSYLMATLLVVARVDKMRVKSLFMLHLPAVVVACIIGAGLFLLQDRPVMTNPLVRTGQDMDLAPHRFFKDRVFTQAGSRQIRTRWEGRQARDVVYYDANMQRPVYISEINMGSTGRTQFYVDERGRQVILRSPRLPDGISRIPYSDFTRRNNATDMQIFRAYENQMRDLYRWLSARGSLSGIHLYILFGALFVTFLMISIPVVFAMNDTGWGFSGIIGIFLVLAILPYLYNLIIKAVGRFLVLTSFMGAYAYLFPAVVFGICGLLLDLLVKARSRARSQ